MIKENISIKNVKKSNVGITLIALVLTIIVLIIIATIVINIATHSNNGIIVRASEAEFKNRMSVFLEELNVYELDKIIIGGGTANSINAGDILDNLVKEEIIQIDDENEGPVANENINAVLPSIKKEKKNRIIVYQSELYYVTNKDNSNYQNEVKWCRDLGIHVLEYALDGSGGATGIKATNGSYQEVNGTYVCTPNTNDGFVSGETRYLNAVENKLVAGNWINSKPSDDWYDYGNQKWANIYVESNGKEAYYVWIPRYCYKALDNERMDVKFINLSNEYEYLDGDSVQTVEWSSLENDGYQIPDAFWWDSNNNGQKDEGEQIAGFWSAKYELAEGQTQRTVNYDFSISKRTS